MPVRRPSALRFLTPPNRFPRAMQKFYLSPSSTAIFSDHFGVREDVPLHGALDFGLRCARFQIQLRIHRIKLEKIAVRTAWRRARPPVADFSEIVAPLPRAIRKLLLFCHSLREFSRVSRKVEQHPMDPG